MNRPGHTLAEALCALALSSVLILAAATSLGAARKAHLTSDENARARTAARESADILAEAVSSSSIYTLRGDTAIDLQIPILSGAACNIEHSAVLLPPHRATGEPITARSQPVEPGDQIFILYYDSLTASRIWWNTAIDSVQERTTSSPCGPIEGWTHSADANASRLRLTLRDPLPASAEIGDPVLVARPGRYALYNAGGGDWMLGWRRCPEPTLPCGVIQPVAGPLRTRTARGLVLENPEPGVVRITARGKGGGDHTAVRQVEPGGDLVSP